MYYNDEEYLVPPTYLYAPMRQNYEGESISGDATWTEGGPVTKCNLAWSDMNHMTTAVSTDSPYTCGQLLNVRFEDTGKEVTVKVVDTVAGYPQNRLNLHRQVFEALGANLDWGIIPIRIAVVPTDGNGQLRDVLWNVLGQTYPGATIKNSQWQEEENVSGGYLKESYLFTLGTSEGDMTVRGDVVFHPNTKRIRSINLTETS
ncbi:RlpA-like double-psi beta-barrel domain-containing protein [Alkalibacillus almallahensis]|uniref:RlpA-like double-psi beta-barrel domain-containing protein n=1 Tax=Alkalibacillus almallahensis TaxID=1379154 RepID=UPI00142173C8|nr:RlpA-like double-psi beta-barrel domain-containing protein [Alkalibacillus almallahensis]NIK12085.1 rare lipoprotein A [Alkalibacillus almallahensis]